MKNAPRQHRVVRGQRDYTIPHIVVEQQFVLMTHQHHVEMLQRLEAKGLDIPKSSFPMKSKQVRITFGNDDVKDLELGEKVSKEYKCNECGAVEHFLFTLRRAGENPEWTIRTGQAPEGAEVIGGKGEVRVEETRER